MLINITKKLVIVFIIGVLIGAIIATAGFLIFSKSHRQCSDRPTPPSFSQTDNSGMPGMNGGNNQGNFSKSDKSSKSQGNSGNQNGNQNKPQQMPNGEGGNGMPQVPGSNSTTNSNQS